MKKLLLLFVFSMISCNSNKLELNNIQIMAYNYAPDYSIQKLTPNFIIYSFINSSAESINLRKIDANSDDVVGYSSSIEIKLLEQITTDAKLKDETFFVEKVTPEIEIYDGPIIRIKISYTNGKEMSFIFQAKNYDENSKFFLYKNLYDSIIENSKPELFDGKKLELLKRKQKDFAKYVHHKDSLLLPIPNIFPPPPPLDEVKFVKPK
ncbi:hypothetical protein [Flavobacterium sp. SM2513]|uniref:hypothetical protein n=1 Tax=Flavobacterium sp. SM2513 TaxID=3424766 RepID=UPI003D7F3867